MGSRSHDKFGPDRRRTKGKEAPEFKIGKSCNVVPYVPITEYVWHIQRTAGFAVVCQISRLRWWVWKSNIHSKSVNFEICPQA